MTPKNTLCLWFNHDAEEAARFYAATFPDKWGRLEVCNFPFISKRRE